LSTAAPDYNDSVFINCPFDKEYLPLLQAIVYTVYRCGFHPQSALGDDNALVNRLSKIEHYIENCRYGIHDISRTEVNVNSLPRFNMPFELGIFFGAKKFGSRTQKLKNALVFERVKFSYQQYISDLNGIDTKAHNADPGIVIRETRNWLKTSSRRDSIPGYKAIISEFTIFQNTLPDIAKNLDVDVADIPFNELCYIVEEVIKKQTNLL
jgi:hypothetical protein